MKAGSREGVWGSSCLCPHFVSHPLPTGPQFSCRCECVRPPSVLSGRELAVLYGAEFGERLALKHPPTQPLPPTLSPCRTPDFLGRGRSYPPSPFPGLCGRQGSLLLWAIQPPVGLGFSKIAREREIQDSFFFFFKLPPWTVWGWCLSSVALLSAFRLVGGESLLNPVMFWICVIEGGLPGNLSRDLLIPWECWARSGEMVYSVVYLLDLS